MALDAESFKKIFPSFAGDDPAYLSQMINVAEPQVSSKIPQTIFDYAWGCLTAHIIMSTKTGTNPVTEESVGARKQAYLATDEQFKTTPFGREYKRLLDTYQGFEPAMFYVV